MKVLKADKRTIDAIQKADSLGRNLTVNTKSTLSINKKNSAVASGGGGVAIFKAVTTSTMATGGIGNVYDMLDVLIEADATIKFVDSAYGIPQVITIPVIKSGDIWVSTQLMGLI